MLCFNVYCQMFLRLWSVIDLVVIMQKSVLGAADPKLENGRSKESRRLWKDDVDNRIPQMGHDMHLVWLNHVVLIFIALTLSVKCQAASLVSKYF